MCPIEPVSTLFLGPGAADFGALSVVLVLYAIGAARSAFGGGQVLARAA